MKIASTAVADEVTRQFDAARHHQPVMDPDAVARIVEDVIRSLSGSMTLAEVKLYRELDTLAKVIHAAKKQIGDVRPDDISVRHIPEATDELDAVVKATAEATGAILDRAEALERLGATLPKEVGAQISEAVTGIFEACNFQDITGQRIRKVVKTLNYIEGKIDTLLAAFGDELGDIELPPEIEPEGDAALLHGPQLTQNANSQSDIDAILAGLF